jgi:hypothetical protein
VQLTNSSQRHQSLSQFKQALEFVGGSDLLRHHCPHAAVHHVSVKVNVINHSIQANHIFSSCQCHMALFALQGRPNQHSKQSQHTATVTQWLSVFKLHSWLGTTVQEHLGQYCPNANASAEVAQERPRPVRRWTSWLPSVPQRNLSVIVLASIWPERLIASVLAIAARLTPMKRPSSG